MNLLEPIREHFGVPIRISSGFRSPILNRAVGGASTSQHRNGEAADFIIPGFTVTEVFDWIRQSDLPFDQLIHEFSQWVHISFSSRHRRQAFYVK